MSKILLIDDDETITTAIHFALEGHGYEVIVAYDGEEGNKKYVEHNPDLVLTDLMMPMSSGLDVIRFIREDKKENTPIIMLSSEGQNDVVITAFDIGANDYLVKPIRSTELITRIKKILKRRT